MKKSAARNSLAGSITATSALVVAAFLAPGAWKVVGLPPVAWAKFLQLATVAVWLAAVGFGLVALKRPDKRVLIAAGALAAVSLIATQASGNFFASLVYDIYGDMPLLQWFALLGLLLVGAGLATDGGVVRGLQGVVIVASLLSVFMIVWSLLPNEGGFSIVFGSSAYSVPAMAPLVAVALGLAKVEKNRPWVWRALAALIAVAVAWAAGSLMGTLAVAFAAIVVLAFEPSVLGIPEKLRLGSKRVATALCVVAVAGVVFLSVPALSGSLLPEKRAADFGSSISSRIYLWNGAERMFAEKPLLGFGPSGYRLHAVEYLDAGVFPSLVTLGGDPISFSPPSPHSLMWELLTRLGVLGFAAFAALLVVGFLAYRRVIATEDGPRAILRRALAAAAIVYLFALMTTPVHFASGLMGALLCGLAIAPKAGGPKEPATKPSKATRWSFVVIAIVLIAVAGWVAAGKSTGNIDDATDLASIQARIERAASIIPGEPLNERRRLEVALIGAHDDASIAAAREAIDGAPGYVLDFAPNLAMFAAIGLDEADISGRTDVSWEAAKLATAEGRIPNVPLVIAERLHLAIIQGDTEAVKRLVVPARAILDSYPAVEEYVTRADELLGQAR